ncbi:MAG: metallophosphoesterase [Promethearchaeota archaeon]
MQVLVFGDLHADRAATETVAERLKTVDYGFCLGDLSQWGRGLRETAALLDVGTDLYLLPGNHETEKELEQICRDYPSFHLLHGKHIALGETNVAGLGGGREGGIGRFLLSDKETAQILAQFRGLPSLVMVTHCPPFETAVDLTWGNKHIGSPPLRQFILDEQPTAVYSGHVHERRGETDKLGTTKLISVGSEGIFLDI